MALEERQDLYHWYPTISLQPSSTVFSKSRRITVGAPSKSLAMVNESCGKKEENSFRQCESVLDYLGTHGSRWEVHQQQFTVQATTQYVGIQYSQNLSKIPTRTIKEEQLSRIEPSYSFMEAYWALQVSFCTGVAKRVRIRELIADLLPAYLTKVLHSSDSWFQKQIPDIVKSLREEDIRQWLVGKTEEQREYLWTSVRGILDLLKTTGIDGEGFFSIAWIMPGISEPRCLKIECERESQWAKILADSQHCATFAYFTPNCLETDHLKCRGPASLWLFTSPVLSTSVSFHQTSVRKSIQGSTWKFQDGERYYIGKKDLHIQVKVDQKPMDENTKLLLRRSITWTVPDDIWRRLVLKQQRPTLREKQDGQALAHPVLVLADR